MHVFAWAHMACCVECLEDLAFLGFEGCSRTLVGNGQVAFDFEHL